MTDKEIDNIEFDDYFSKIDEMSSEKSDAIINGDKIVQILDILRATGGIDYDHEIKTLKNKIDDLQQNGFKNIEGMVRINGLLYILMGFMDERIKKEFNLDGNSMNIHSDIGIDLLDYEKVNIRSIAFADITKNLEFSNDMDKAKEKYLDIMKKYFNDILYIKDNELSYLQITVSSCDCLKYMSYELENISIEDYSNPIFNIIKYLNKLLKTRIDENQFENEFEAFFAIFDLGYRYICGSEDNLAKDLLKEYINQLVRVNKLYIEENKKTDIIEKDIDNFIEYIDSIYYGDYQDLILMSNYPSINLKLTGEENDGELVEFFL